MISYPTDRCIFCQVKLRYDHNGFKSCPNLSCNNGYQINNNRIVFTFNVNDCRYAVTIDAINNKSHIVKYEDINWAYKENKLLDLSIEEWKNLIIRVESLQAFS